MNVMIGHHISSSTAAVSTGFRISPHDRLTIDGIPYRFMGRSGDLISLQREDGQGLIDQYKVENLARLSATGHIRHEVEYFLPDDLKTRPASIDAGFRTSMLTPAQQRRFHVTHAQIQALDDMVTEGLIRPTTAEIEKVRKELEERVQPYLAKDVTERDMLAEVSATGKAAKTRGGRKKESIELYSSDYLRKLYAAFRKGGVEALVDGLSKSGNRFTQLRPEELGLLMEIIRGSYLTPERKSITATVLDVQRGFQAENARRADQGLAPLRIPGRDAVRGVIKRLGKFRVMVARYGLEHAMKELRPVGKGLDISRPGERVEIDEWKIDLISILDSANLRDVLGPEVMDAIGLDKTKSRWWLTAAIDCRTRIILGAKLTRNPTSSAARECLRMVVSDKSVISDAVGAVALWSQAVVPETLVADNGAAFKSEIFTNACLDLQVAILRTIGGIPGMRGTIERVFLTAGLDLMPRLKGRTFSNPQERGDYNANDRACLDAESVAFVLIRWIVDIYHNSPHEGLGGRTPLEQWEADMADGNYPLRALPDTRSKRLAFGNATRRKVSRAGVVVMGIQFHSHALATHFIENESQQVDLRWDPDDLGAIDAFVGGEWIELDAVHDRFKGVNLQVWIKARKALRARSASRKTWNRNTVFRAIDDIEDLVRKGSALFDVVDTSLSDTRLGQLEKDLYSSFVIGTAETLHADGEQPGREIPARAPDPDTPRDARKARQKSTSGKAGKTSTPPHDDLGPDIPTLDSHKEQTRNAHAKPRMAWRPRKQDGADK